MSVYLLPLFPLPLVLFPGAPLPLHIFEPRYRQMLSDCIAGDSRFGIIYRPEDETELEAALTATGAGEPAILRLVRGDRAMLGRIVSELAGDDEAEVVGAQGV